MTVILALDPAAQCGWAHSNGQSGTWNLAALGSSSRDAQLAAFRDRLLEVFADWGFAKIVYEEASFGSNNPATRQAHSEKIGVIKLVAIDVGARVVGYVPTTLKKFATGNGLAKKDQVMAACKRVLGIEPRDDNEADALWLLEMGKVNYQPPRSEKSRKRAVRKARKKEPKLF